ncbi:hypothetical protein [Azospira restricta]|uniref:PilZ domain-containing protein n=1 Tax=Azospira restricta TaxID=404405 RepID=A0A974SRG0_9RHOO|nr:hypothetical protein [Azospira restricta]QRJ65064.1 hypothetical protein IWH25_06905 [Azospira restricta]
MILNLFSSRPDHPLADAKEVKRVLAELPPDNAFKAVDEIAGWLESLANAEDFRVDLLFDVARQLDDAVQPHLKRLARDYFGTPRLSRAEEKRLWSANFGYWGLLAAVCERCLTALADKGSGDKGGEKGAEALRGALPLVAARTIAALGQQVKWMEFRYGPIEANLWHRLGRAYLIAEAGKVAQKPLQLYPNVPGSTTVAGEYLHVLAFHASSMDSLLPLEIELADRLIAHFQSGFAFSPDGHEQGVYWVDAAKAQPPMRMAKVPSAMTPTLRFFSPGAVPKALDELIRHVERGEVPTDLHLGGQYQAKTVLPVLRHLALYWAPQPPQREHPRHNVKTRLAVLHGFDDSFTVFAGEVARVGKERAAESWVVENVSLGGFGAAVDNLRGDWLKVGSLISMQPEGGDNWVLGIVRRFSRDSETQAGVGIQTLARQATAIELRPRSATYSVGSGVPGIRLPEDRAPGEVRLVLPHATFDIRESLEYASGDKRYLLTPIELIESGADFEIARYRELVES